jgi:hypothetical protein
VGTGLFKELVFLIPLFRGAQFRHTGAGALPVIQLNNAETHWLADELRTDPADYLKCFLPLHARQRDGCGGEITDRHLTVFSADKCGHREKWTDVGMLLLDSLYHLLPGKCLLYGWGRCGPGGSR